MKTTLALSLLGIAYLYPETTILAIILVSFILHCISKFTSERKASKPVEQLDAYSQSKDIFTNTENEYYLQTKTRKNRKKVTIQQEKEEKNNNKIPTGLPNNLDLMKYGEIQDLCRSLNITNLNRKKKVLVLEIKKKYSS